MFSAHAGLFYLAFHHWISTDYGRDLHVFPTVAVGGGTPCRRTQPTNFVPCATTGRRHAPCARLFLAHICGGHVPQSAYRRHHSTETALLKVLADIYGAIDRQQVTLLGLLDFSAAFDCVDHILLRRLRHEFGI